MMSYHHHDDEECDGWEGVSQARWAPRMDDEE
jgi:hypothetical protein